MAKKDEPLKIRIDDVEYDIETDFTLGDLEFLEDYIGRSLDEPGALTSMRGIVALTYLVRKRGKPDLDIEEIRGLTMSSFGKPDPPRKAARKKAAA